MSEYWKSVPRKFCDFCKCWITDNKPSVDFHERGKRHQENVELRLREVRKKSLQDSRDKEQMDKEMEKMEKAAMEAFKKDLKDNPELAAKYGVSLEPKPSAEQDTSGKSEGEEGSATEKKSRKRKSKGQGKEWYEAVTPEGYSYYWSTKTGESTWTEPKEYVSIVEQTEAEEPKEKEEENTDTTQPSSDTLNDAQTSTSTPAPVNQKTGFGSWQVVREEKQPEMYDESSAPPELDSIPLPSAPTESSDAKPQKPKFKEKTVSSLGPSTQSGPVSFKKRKVASGARNVRQRDKDD